MNREEYEDYKKMMLPILRGMMSENEVEMTMMYFNKAYNEVQSDEFYTFFHLMLKFISTISLLAYLNLYQ